MISEGQFLLGLMITLSIGLVVLFKKLDTDGEFPLFLHWFCAIVSSLLLIIAIFPIVRWLDSDSTQYYSRRVNIQSIKNNDEVGGNFMLGCGNIEQTEYYYYYYKSVEGYVRGKKPVDKTFIVEDGSDKPHIEVYMTHYESKSGLFKYIDEEDEKYKIIVPKGTVVNRFEVY
jgi:hypothetical protein